MSQNPRAALRVIPTPAASHVVSAPPILTASTHTIDFTCGLCRTILMHADSGQVHNLVILCTICGSYNSTDA
jgi:hypothetical protein